MIAPPTKHVKRRSNTRFENLWVVVKDMTCKNWMKSNGEICTVDSSKSRQTPKRSRRKKYDHQPKSKSLLIGRPCIDSLLNPPLMRRRCLLMTIINKSKSTADVGAIAGRRRSGEDGGLVVLCGYRLGRDGYCIRKRILYQNLSIFSVSDQ